MGSSDGGSSRSTRKSADGSLNWGGEAAGLSMGAGRFPLPRTLPCRVLVCDAFLIWCRISGEIYSWNSVTQTQFIEGSLCCSWSLLCFAHAQVQCLEKPFHLKTKLLLLCQSLFQQLLMLNLSCRRSWLKGIRCSCFLMLLLVSIETSCFYFINGV